MQGYFLRQG